MTPCQASTPARLIPFVAPPLRRSVASSRGFTLMELMLALVLTATVAGAVASSLYIAFRVRTSSERTVASVHRLDAIGNILVRDLSNALPPVPNSPVLSRDFLGAADTLDFYCSGPEPKASVQADCRRVQYSLVQDTQAAGRSSLARSVITNLFAPIEVEPDPEQILNDVVSITFAYYDGSDWYDTWDSTQHEDGLPVAVQLTLITAPDGPDVPANQVSYTIPLACGVLNTGTGSTTP